MTAANPASLAPPAPATVLRVKREELTRWLQPEAGYAPDEYLYIVDPLGAWMMRMPVDFDPGKVKRDLDHLLSGSSGWGTSPWSLWA